VPAWLAGLPGVVGVRPGPGHVELEVDGAAEPSAILAAVVARGAAVTRFEIAEPSLEAIFVEHVGRSPEEPSPPAGLLVEPSGPQPTAGLA